MRIAALLLPAYGKRKLTNETEQITGAKMMGIMAKKKALHEGPGTSG